MRAGTREWVGSVDEVGTGDFEDEACDEELEGWDEEEATGTGTDEGEGVRGEVSAVGVKGAKEAATPPNLRNAA